MISKWCTSAVVPKQVCLRQPFELSETVTFLVPG